MLDIDREIRTAIVYIETELNAISLLSIFGLMRNFQCRWILQSRIYKYRECIKLIYTSVDRFEI